jgi:FkbM family methyltransferase
MDSGEIATAWRWTIAAQSGKDRRMNEPLAPGAPRRLTEIVDIGANPIDGDPPYKAMLQAGLCRVTGFEPQERALAELEARRGPNERYLPYVIADGKPHTLHICRHSGLTSLLEPNRAVTDLYRDLGPNSEIIERRAGLQTRRLDDLAEIERIDLLKIDVQGSELLIFQNGRKLLSRAVAIQTEVSFLPIYHGQPAHGEIDVELRTLGFLPHRYIHAKTFAMVGYAEFSRQLIDGDVLYLRDFTRPDLMDDDQLEQLAAICRHCYDAPDSARHCLRVLEARHRRAG